METRRRLLCRYRARDAAGLVHGNHGRSPAHRIDDGRPPGPRVSRWRLDKKGAWFPLNTVGPHVAPYPSAMATTFPRIRRPEHDRAAARGPGQAPGSRVRAAFDDPAHGFLHPVDLDVAQREHDAFVETARRRSDRRVHVLDDRDATARTSSTRSIRCWSPDRGAIPLRPGKPNRAVEPAAHRGLDARRRHPDGRAGSRRPGTIEGGDTFWLRPDLFCIGRTLRTNDARRPAAGRRSSAATCGSSTCRTGAARPS